MRALLFAVAFAIAVLGMAPLDGILLPMIQEPLKEAGVDLRIDGVHFALPAGIRTGDVHVSTDGASLAIESLYVGLSRTFDAQACDGTISGSVTSTSVEVALHDVNPSRCLRVGKLEFETTLRGGLTAEGFDLFRPSTLPGGADSKALRAKLDLTSDSGVFRGAIPGAGDGGGDLPLGEWEFTDLSVKASIDGNQINIEDGRATTSGVQWELLSAQLPEAGERSGLRVDFRARLAGEAPRARALLGLMPRAAEGKDGWRRYRVVGSLAAPRMVGLD